MNVGGEQESLKWLERKLCYNIYIGGSGGRLHYLYLADPKDALKRPSVTQQNWGETTLKVKFAGRKGAELLLADLKKRFPPNVRLSALAVLHPGFWFRNRAVADDEDSRAEFIKSCKKKFDVLVGRYGALDVQVGVKHIPAIINASNANAGWDSLEVLMGSYMRFPLMLAPLQWKSHLQNDAITARWPEIVKLVITT